LLGHPVACGHYVDLKQSGFAIVFAAVKSSTPTLTHIIQSQGRGSVVAVTSLGDDVFVVRDNDQEQVEDEEVEDEEVEEEGQVEVYDAVTLTLQRHIAVRGLGPHPTGVVACGNNQCIYVSHNCGWIRTTSTIHRVKLSGKNAVKQWCVARGAAGLSVNVAHNLVVACQEAKKLQEYTTHGSLVREIRLHGVSSPWHAIQLSTGDYVVSQNTSPGVVSVVGVDGHVIHSYGRSRTSDVGRMKNPSLAVTRNNNILVADQRNNRILSINRSTGCVQELTLSVGYGMQQPVGLCLDESRGRLYVGEVGRQRLVLVFDNVNL